MPLKHKIFRIIPHLIFWGAWVILLLMQNEKITTKQSIVFANILAVAAVVVYTNLYYLLKHYFFTKKYLQYALWLLLLLCIGAFILDFILQKNNSALNTSYAQNFINLFMFVLITSSFKIYREFGKRELTLLKLNTAQLQSELSLLKAQINPHFLFNSLNNLYGLVVQHKNEIASDIILKLADLMRYLLESSKASQVSLKQEVSFIENYIALEKIRVSSKNDIQFDVVGLEKDVQVPPLLLIPLVENVFKHGIQNSTTAGFAHFTLSVQGNDLFFETKNTVGAKVSDNKAHSVGLDNLKRRLEIIYPNKHILDLEEQNNIFTATLHITL